MKHRNQKTQTRRTNLPIKPDKAPFIDHLRELRTRLLWIVATILLAGTAVYFVQERIVNWLLAPAHHQQFIYTSPIGGISFLFQVCTYVGIAVSIPMIVYQLLMFLAPLMSDATRHSLLRYASWSALLAAIGIVCGYYIGLPSALHFLSNQFTSKQIRPLFTIQEYMSFVTLYLLGSAMLLQLPLLLLLVNKIHRVRPRSLFKGERYVIVVAFIVSMIMVPTVNVINQLIIAVPIIVMYQIGIGLVWLEHRRHQQPDWLIDLLRRDQQIQLEREQRAIQLIPIVTTNRHSQKYHHIAIAS